jgi:pantoate--beta-alanine ligase
MSIQLANTIAEARELIWAARRAGKSIGCVPTMGALHAGHASLIERARAECGFVVVTVFVNPIQFDQPSDYERYARTLPADVALCEARGADLVFAPTVEEMYPEPARAFVEVPALAEHLCGRFRPGHFRGVCTVVAKLFLITQPDAAYFGEKDAQQLAVIDRMARDLNFPVRVIPVATVREADGLAMSSRNARLSPEERRAAPALYRALETARCAIACGERDADLIKAAALQSLASEPAFRLEYLEVVDPATFHPVATVTFPVRIAAAAWLGGTRLIDNISAPS